MRCTRDAIAGADLRRVRALLKDDIGLHLLQYIAEGFGGSAAAGGAGERAEKRIPSPLNPKNEDCSQDNGRFMSSWHRRLALSDHWFARLARSAYRLQYTFSIPAPRLVVKPFVFLYVTLRGIYFFLKRVLICEPFFKAHCAEYGRNVHTGSHLHWIVGVGPGKMVVGDNVTVDGTCNFLFAIRYSDTPTLRIGSNTCVGHDCAFVVGREVTIGRHCRIAANVQMFDTPGHPLDPAARFKGLPARDEDVRPIIIGDNVWIGSSVIIFPGVTIGDNSVISIGSVVVASVPANVIVAGNPARQIGKLSS
ncbi:MAG: 2,3,4,5-tetrahydropyridine-2,6-dicarboxylate N-acetyltransferase [Anaerolineales bacterium]|nr:2,3,4,5-tetrahydropyridine-2,6-dicarboxylate N-acetyltransferase [Anaerolineales bacterium]